LALWLRHGQFGAARAAVQEKLYGERLILGLRRDLTVPFEPPRAAIFSIGRHLVSVRPLQESDVAVLFDMKAPGITHEGVRKRLTRLVLLQMNIPTCYVAVTPDDKPCYMQWLIPAQHSAKIRAFYDIVPPLAPDEALIDYAFTLEAYRGQGIMACAMAQIAQRAVDVGARWVITFVLHDHVTSLKSCKRAGFEPYLMCRETRRLFRRRVTFTPLPAGSPYPFERARQPARAGTAGRGDECR
jgi:GNAT superfamily N-acetyltransferase